MGCMAGMKRVNSVNYVGTCRYQGKPSVCEFVNIEEGKIVIWTTKGEDKVYGQEDFLDVKVTAVIILPQGLNLVIAAVVDGVQMAFQLEYTHLNTNEYINEKDLGSQLVFEQLAKRRDRAGRIQRFLDTICAPIKLNDIDVNTLKRLEFRNTMKIEESYDEIMATL